MNLGTILAIIIIIVLLVILWKIFKPYIIRYDTTILFTGGLGSGKTLESVKKAVVLTRKNRFFKYTWANFIIKIKNHYRTRKAKKYIKCFWKCKKCVKPLKKCEALKKKPLLYSNIPVHFRSHIFGFKKEWATVLDIEHIMLLKQINEYSVVFIDEFPQFISQFEWDIDLVQKNCNEFITYFRHYIGGYFITNAQSEDEIECHFRRKLNIGIWCFDFKKHLFGLFYTNRMCDFMLSENVQTMSTTYIEENTRLHFGLFARGTYDSRCYSPRYDKVDVKIKNTKKWRKLKTTKVLRVRNYVSPLDDKTTTQQVEAMHKEVEKLERSNNQ